MSPRHASGERSYAHLGVQTRSSHPLSIAGADAACGSEPDGCSHYALITDNRRLVNSVAPTYSSVIPEIAATSMPGSGTRPNTLANGRYGIANVTTMSPIVEIRRSFPGRL